MVRPSLGPVRTNRSEIDLRAEFELLLFGNSIKIPHSHLCIHRAMRRDSNLNPIRCTCFTVSNSTESDPDCSYCHGEGYLWDEQWVYCYSMYLSAADGLARKYLHVAAGLERTDYKVFFFRYNTPIKYEDKIVQVQLDDEGNIVLPYVRSSIYKPGTIKKMRSDYGRVEYLAVYCKEDDAWRTDNYE